MGTSATRMRCACPIYCLDIPVDAKKVSMGMDTAVSVSDLEYFGMYEFVFNELK